MPRNSLYPGGSEQLNIVVPVGVKGALRAVAERQHRSVSQVVAIILRSYLQEHSELYPERQEV